MTDNKKGLEKLMSNIEKYVKGEQSLPDCLTQHSIICFNDLDDYIEYFSDGWSKDITLNLFKIVYRAVNGDEKAYSRLKVDLGIEECNLQIVKITGTKEESPWDTKKKYLET